MEKVIIVMILLSSPVFAYNPSYNATNFAVINAAIVSSIASSNIAIQKKHCELLKQCIEYKGGKACIQKYKCKTKGANQ